MFRHSDWTWAKARAFWQKNPSHRDMGILLHKLCVVDVDSHTLAEELEQRFPALTETACEMTAKGRHYFFERSALADCHGFYDGRSHVMVHVDFKTICAPCPLTGDSTSGLIVTAPNTGKRWIRPPWDFGGCYMPDRLPQIPDDLLRAVAVPKHHVVEEAVLAFTEDSSQLEVRQDTWLPRFSYLAPFFDDLESSEIHVPVGTADLMTELLYICKHKTPSTWPLPDLAGLQRLADFLGCPTTVQGLLQVGQMPPTSACGRLHAMEQLSPEWASAACRKGLIPVDDDLASWLTYQPLKPDVGASAAYGESWLFPIRDSISLSPGRPVLNLVDADKIPDKVLVVLEEYPMHVMLGGGSALSAVCPNVAEGSDYDLFIHGVTPEEASRMLEDIQELLEPDAVTRTGTAITMVVDDTLVQVILWLFDDPEHVLRSFDIAACQVGLMTNPEGQLIGVATPQWEHAMHHMTFWVDLGSWSAALVPRVLKYYTKGFDVVLPGMPRWRLLPAAKQASRTRSRTAGIINLFWMEQLVEQQTVCSSWLSRATKMRERLALRRPTFKEVHQTLTRYNNWGARRASGYAELLPPQALPHVIRTMVISGMRWLGLIPDPAPGPPAPVEWRIAPRGRNLYPCSPCLREAFVV